MAIREVIISASDEEADWIKHVKRNPPDVEMADYSSLWPVIQILRGGKGSGNWGHKGRKGKRGGSSRAGASLPKGTAPDGTVSVDEKAKSWLLSNVAPERREFRFTVDVSSDERADYKWSIAKQLSKDTGIDAELQNRFITDWAETSNDNQYASLLAQKTAGEKFGVELSEFQQKRWDKVNEDRTIRLNKMERGAKVGASLSDSTASPYENIFDGTLDPKAGKFKNHETATKATLDAMYSQTQAELKEAGIESVTLYRGISAYHGRFTRSYNVPPEGEVVSLSDNVLGSWTINPGTASIFGTGGTVVKMEVPAERIFSTAKTGFGTLGETEFVVIGGKNMGQARIMNEEVVNSFVTPRDWS